MSSHRFLKYSTRDFENEAFREEIYNTLKYYEIIFVDLAQAASQQGVQADAQHCDNCGAELQTYCKKCFNSGASKRTA